MKSMLTVKMLMDSYMVLIPLKKFLDLINEQKRKLELSWLTS